MYPLNFVQHSDLRWDLRSDTVTTPCDGMRAAMAAAEVGDNVLGCDPTVAALEGRMAEMLGKQAALFVSSGTQSNLIAALSHCQRGEAVIVGQDYHLYKYEAGGAAVLGGIFLRSLPLLPDKSLSLSAIAAAVLPDDPHFAPCRLLGLENTVYGQPIALATLHAMVDCGHQHGLEVHLDGARLFNATAALQCSVKQMVTPFDSVSVCLSKGLGAPVGSVLVGSDAFIARARRWQKMLGGGMRQSGILAAAGLYALDHGIDRLVDDHRRAAQLAQILQNLGRGKVHQATNMVFWSPDGMDIPSLQQRLAAYDIAILDENPQRLVLHHQISDDGLQVVQDALHQVLS